MYRARDTSHEGSQPDKRRRGVVELLINAVGPPPSTTPTYDIWEWGMINQQDFNNSWEERAWEK